MPYPNEHACRLKEPSLFQKDSFRRVTRDHNGKQYSVIMGKLTGDDKMTEQAYRYPKASWDADEAKKHCTEHGGRFEAARDSENTLDQTTTKEVKVMPETRTIEELEAETESLELQLLELQEIVAEKDSQIAALTDTNKQLTKDLSILKANTMLEKAELTAQTITASILNESSISDTLHEKVKSMVDFKKHMAEDGTFNEQAFTEAFAAEVKDWESRITPGASVGLSDAKHDTNIRTVQYADENASIVSRVK